MNKYIFLLLTLGCLSVTAQQRRTLEPVSVIFDTDIGPDYDDVGAIALLHALADSGKVNILATIACNKYPNVASVLNVFNTYFNRPDLPIGVPKGYAINESDSQHWTDTIIKRYPHRITSNDKVPDAVGLYRKLLSHQPDRSVTIITVGFLTNLANLLNSPPDRYSKLNGYQLIRTKVKNLVSMAGKFPKGREYNVFKDAPSSLTVFNSWPTPIIFSGFEIGDKIKTGLKLITAKKITNSPVKDVYAISIPKASSDSNGRSSWDQTTVLVAINSHVPYYDLIEGKIKVNREGVTTWSQDQKGHYYLLEKMPYELVGSLIEKLMMHQPIKN